MSNRPTGNPSRSARVQQARAADRAQSQRTLVIGVVVVVLAVAATVAVIVGVRSSSQEATDAVTGPNAGSLVTGTIKVTGNSLPQESVDSQTGAPTGPDPAVGKVAPAITGQKFDESTLTIPGAGRPKVVMFVAHWCPHCQKEVPEITQYLQSQQANPTNVDLYAVSTAVDESRGNYPPAKWLQGEKFPVPTIADDKKGTAAQAYGVGGFPYFVAVSADGRVVQRTSGELQMSQFQALMDAAKAGSAASTPTATAAP